MPLDFSQLTGQISELAERTHDGRIDIANRTIAAIDHIRDSSDDLVTLRDRIERDRGRYTWLVAEIRERLDAAYDPPPLPPDHAVVATDGSQVDVDRQAPAPWFLLNIGTVSIRYGAQPGANLENRARVYGLEEDLVLTNPQNRVQQEEIQGSLLGYVREVEEVKALVDLVKNLPQDMPVLALVDGSLILWGLTGQSHGEFVRRALITDGILAALEELRQEAQKRPLAVASYISQPRATEAVNTQRIKLCPFDVADCDRNCGTTRPMERPCDDVARVVDRSVFQHILAPGQRSALFGSHSSVVDDYYGPHKILFFYLHAGNEVARVEIPQWVLGNGSVDMLHALLNEQVRLGNGYPVTLAEAHEQAVVRMPDRDLFWQLVESELTGGRLAARTSQKALAKGRRWV